MQISAITELDFYKIDRCRRVISHDCAQKFAAIDLGVPLRCYGLSWRSDILEPIILRSPDCLTVWIGVDQQLAAISLDEGRIIVALPLIDYLVQIVAIADVIAVLTQEKVLLFNPGGSIAVPGLMRYVSKPMAARSGPPTVWGRHRSTLWR